jgi:prepilin-type N-terminal cleavage/methylation domain-containing protein
MNTNQTVASGKWQVARASARRFHRVTCHPSLVTCRAFTLVEIAICLAIIGIALVAIIGVLPRGLDVQRENRERTVINQDATIFMEAIRNGARGADDLTNYVYAIVITNATAVSFGYVNPALEPQMNFPRATLFPTVNNWYPILTNGGNIVGALGTPEFVSGNNTNHIYAYVRSISGPAMEKPPQDNGLLLGDSFGYRIICENVPVQSADNSTYVKDLQWNLHELRQTFYWPILPNGQLPPRPPSQIFRTLIAGQIHTDFVNVSGQTNYFYQSQSFTNAP